MFYKNARIFTKEFTFQEGAFEVVDGKYADFVITNTDYSEKRVFIGGKEL
jgi:hypothetical protein